jgi:predicted phage terminase large subunit-like protein
MAAVADAETITLRPQAGPQEAFLATPADIAIYGGAAGGGKSWALLLEPLRHIHNPEFGAVIFRRTFPQITNEGGLWDESMSLYPLLGADPIAGDLWYRFPSGARVSFAHLQHDKTVFDHQGSQIPLIGFDELTHFTEFQFFYMLSRNRSTCGVRPYVRATTNPDADSWVAKFIAWWIHQETGYPIKARAGVLRWFIRIGSEIVWADSPDELRARFPELGDDVQPKSVTFIPARLEDNKILLEKDPGYKANLLAQSLVERERLLGGNWKIRPTAGVIFNRAWFEIVSAAPANARRIRYWDKAGTQDGGKRTAGVRMALDANGIYYVENVTKGQWGALQRERVVKQTAESDGKNVAIVIEQEPGSGGKESAENTIRMLAGYNVRADRATGDKFERMQPMSAQAEAGNVKIVRGPWNEEYLAELHATEPNAPFVDQADASAGAFNMVTLAPQAPDIPLSESYATY